ncbi:hypothetical protein TNCV_3245741 [Trichonephila clavipes]|nr:hypothetical protein TNCV_3245741 [Trichonephila clavipes]
MCVPEDDDRSTMKTLLVLLRLLINAPTSFGFERGFEWLFQTRRKHVTENRNQEDAEPTFLVIIMIRSQDHAKNSFMEVVEAMEIDMQLKKNAWIIAKSHKKIYKGTHLITTKCNKEESC